MLQLTGKINGKKYRKLIDYMKQECEVFSFHLPNLRQRYIVEKNSQHFPEICLDNYANDPDDNDFMNYKTNVEPIIGNFRDFIIKEYTDVEYINTIYGNKMEIKVVRFDSSLIKNLKIVKSLYDWKYPNMPEDLCFYRNGICFLKSIAHEKLSFIMSDDLSVKKKLIEIGIEFNEFSEEEVSFLK